MPLPPPSTPPVSAGIVENMSWFVCGNCGHESHIFGSGARLGGSGGVACAVHDALLWYGSHACACTACGEHVECVGYACHRGWPHGNPSGHLMQAGRRRRLQTWTWNCWARSAPIYMLAGMLGAQHAEQRVVVRQLL